MSRSQRSEEEEVMMITMRSRGIDTSSGEGVLNISFNFSLVLLWFSFGEVLVEVCSEI